MNIVTCDSISEAFQQQYKFDKHKKRLSEINEKGPEIKRVLNPEYDALRLDMFKNRLKRRHYNEQGRLVEIGRGNKAMFERISKLYTKKPVQNEMASVSKMIQDSKIFPENMRKERIAEENSKILEKLLFPPRKSPVHPSAERLAKEHEKAMECRDRLQKSKQSWKSNFKRIWEKSQSIKLALPPISPQERGHQGSFRSVPKAKRRKPQAECRSEKIEKKRRAEEDAEVYQAMIGEFEEEDEDEGAKEVKNLPHVGTSPELPSTKEYADDFDEK